MFNGIIKIENMDQILENLYLGDLMAASSKDILLKVGITHILTMAKGHPP